VSLWGPQFEAWLYRQFFCNMFWFCPEDDSNFLFLHVHFMASSTQFVILCITESRLLHLGHVFVGIKFISASRLWVVRMSYMAAYHVDLIGAASQVVLRVRHIRFQPTARFFSCYPHLAVWVVVHGQL
jgi:hypothetical protein